ncbi:MAG: transposase [Phycisphaerae bacterium]|nr:transposase [Phycisphaerae bacterium]
MPRRPRVAPGGLVYHVLNRAVARLPLFQKPGDYDAFETVMHLAYDRHPTRILSYCVMPNHWHMVLWPREDGELTAFVRWLTHTHAMRWHTHHGTSGTGHLYQGRFKSFPIQTDEHFLTVCRYVERNAQRARLVQRAEEWRWCSLWRHVHGDDRSRALLHRWPVDPPKTWLADVNEPQNEEELEALRRCIQRGSPYGSDIWQRRTAHRLDLQFTLRPRGRPRKRKPDR